MVGSNARRPVHQEGDDTQGQASVGARLLLGQDEGSEPRLGDPSGQRCREEGEEMNSNTMAFIIGAVVIAVIILAIIVL